MEHDTPFSTLSAENVSWTVVRGHWWSDAADAVPTT